MTRTEYIRLAKAVRNTSMSKSARIELVRNLVDAIKQSTPLMHEISFRKCCNVEDYVDTHVERHMKDDTNDAEV